MGVLDGVDIPLVNQAQGTFTSNWKPEKRQKTARARITPRRKPKAERDQIAAVRAACVERDGHCRVFLAIAAHYEGWAILAALHQIEDGDKCHSRSEWAHMHSRRRSQTRNQAPEIRHDTAHSLMLCTFHHQEYDAHRLIITALSPKGANGPLKLRRAK